MKKVYFQLHVWVLWLLLLLVLLQSLRLAVKSSFSLG